MSDAYEQVRRREDRSGERNKGCKRRERDDRERDEREGRYDQAEE